MSDKTAQPPAAKATAGDIYAKVKDVFEKAAGDPAKIVSALQALRNQAETDGDTAAAEAYTEAVKLIQQAAGLTQAPEAEAEETPADEASEDSAQQAAEAQAGTEQKDDNDPQVAMAALIGSLSKAGKTFSSKNAAAMHTAIKTLAGALAGAGDPVAAKVVKAYGAEPAQKAAGVDLETLTAAFVKSFQPAVDAMTSQAQKAEAVLAELQRQPRTGGPVLTPVEKAVGNGQPAQQNAQPAAGGAQALTVAQELDTLQKMLDTTPEVSLQQAIRQRLAVLNIKQARGLA